MKTHERIITRTLALLLVITSAIIFSSNEMNAKTSPDLKASPQIDEISSSMFPYASIEGPKVAPPQTSLFYYLKDGNGSQIPYDPAIEVEWECTDLYGNYVSSALMPFWDEYKTHLGFPQSGKYILKARFKKYENRVLYYSDWMSIQLDIRN